MGKLGTIVVLLTFACIAHADEKHWAFVPVSAPSVPAVSDSAWAKSPLDCFILSKLESAGLKPAKPADRRTLIRRATFDLTGLPPTPADVEAFVADPSPDAFAKVVERLLASPAYGERWGRHWLDVARYADSNGLDENHAYANAWRYRDYVIASFNSDKPYDRFLTEQIAGDLIPPFDHSPARHEHLIATGFLALGPKVLSEPDAKKMEMDVIDEQLDTLGRAFLGMTIGCARCHDHKFDPVSTEDYYGLAGIFSSTRTMDRFERPSQWHENVIGTDDEISAQAEHEANAKRLGAAINELEPKATTPETINQLKRLKADLKKIEDKAPDVATALGVEDGNAVDVPVLLRGDPLQPGKRVPRRFLTAIAGESQQPLPSDHSGRLELAKWLARPDHPLTARVMVNRVWRWHFGHGIVRSPDNFGVLGEKPTHPELLDWLSKRFVESGWSIKAMHRLIMLSSTYQTGSGENRSREVDPENRLFGRTTPRRLEAEAMRDAILFASGTLDPARVGPTLLKVKNRDRIFDAESKDATTYESNRRSIYLPVVRNNQYDLLQLFDCPDAAVSNGDRATTTVASQALFMMNGELMLAASDKFAAGLLAKQVTDEARVQQIYLDAYGRPAEKSECDRLLRLISDFHRRGNPQQAWSWLCQTVLSSNEFVYVN